MASAPALTRQPLAPRVVVTVGTDHHPFDRLISWINDWLGQHPEQVGTFFVQWGTASIPPVCAGSRFLTTEQLDAVLNDAGAVICHGGPGLIADAWARGIVPIAVPRLRRLGEVVDDHQVDFCAKLAELGRIRLALTPAELATFLDEEAHGGNRPGIPRLDSDVEATVARFAALVDELVHRPRRRLLRPRRDRPSSRQYKTQTTAPPADDNQAAGLLVPEVPPIWRASGAPARFGLARVPKEEQE